MENPPGIQVWAKLLFKFEGCTDMINGEFVEDLSVPALMNLFQASARQSMIKRLATHGAD